MKDGNTLNNHSRLPAYIYTFTCSPDERSLCNMEMRSFFGLETSVNILKSNIEIEPSRSPFIKGRVEVMYEGESISEIVEQVKIFTYHIQHLKCYLLKLMIWIKKQK